MIKLTAKSNIVAGSIFPMQALKIKLFQFGTKIEMTINWSSCIAQICSPYSVFYFSAQVCMQESLAM